MQLHAIGDFQCLQEKEKNDANTATPYSHKNTLTRTRKGRNRTREGERRLSEQSHRKSAN